MTLYLSEDDVRQLLTMDDALAAVETAFREQGRGTATNVSRRRVRGEAALLHTMSAALPAVGMVGMKAYTTTRRGGSFHVLLWDDATGRLLSVMEADWLSRVRTGAMSGVATRWLAREDAGTVGIFGTGHQAPAQLEAVCAVRPVERVLAWSRRPDRLAEFCRRMSDRLQVPVEPAPGPRELVENSSILITITTAKEPLFAGEWVRPGTHINAAGSNVWMKREIDDETVARSAVIVADDLGQARLEAGDLLWPLERGRVRWYQVHQLGDVAAGRIARTGPEDITLFLSQGIALADVAVGAAVYRRAVDRGAGRPLIPARE